MSYDDPTFDPEDDHGDDEFAGLTITFDVAELPLEDEDFGLNELLTWPGELTFHPTPWPEDLTS